MLRFLRFSALALASVLAFGPAILLGYLMPLPSANGYASASTILPQSIGDPEVGRIVQSDRDGDGKLDSAEFVGALVTNEDYVLVLDPENRMRESQTWAEIIDFDRETVVIDIGHDDNPELVIMFSKVERDLVAYLYDDRDGDGAVSLSVDGLNVEVTESRFPTVSVISQGQWVRADGKTQGNILFLLDGLIPQQVAWQYPEALAAQIVNDGEVDYEIRVRDVNDDGNLDYQLFRLMLSVPKSYGVYRGLLAQAQDPIGETVPPGGYLLWPLLGHAVSYEDGGYLSSPPAIDVDWMAGRISRVGIWGYPIETGWHFTSVLPIKLGVTNEVDFEVPMAYYDLAENRDGLPELHVRIEQSNPGDMYTAGDLYNGRMATGPIEEVRYSWKSDQSELLSWDYKVGLSGGHGITSTVDFPDFGITSVPYVSVPAVVLSRTWDFVTFVASESGDYVSSEGIYEWGPNMDPDTRPYLWGWTASVPDWSNQTLPVGLRGEYLVEPHSLARLYLSDVDQKLHLVGAEAGVWSMGNGTTLRYANIGGPYFGKWELLTGAWVKSKLLYTNDLVILAQSDTVKVGRALNVRPEIEVSPPGNPAEWRSLRDLLKQYPSEFDPTDLAARYEQLSETEWEIRGATIRGERETSDGLRFILDVGDDATVRNWPAPLSTGMDAGAFLVEYSSGEFSLQPFLGDQYELSIQPGKENADFEYSMSVLATVRNVGNGDSSRLRLVLSASTGSGESENVYETTFELLAGGTWQTTLNWQPPWSGEWLLQASLYDEGGELRTSSYPLRVQGVSSTLGSPQSTFMTTSFGSAPHLLVLLASIAVLAAVGFVAITGSGSR